MSKLPKEFRFIDLSDYGRTPARLLANTLKNTSVTPVQVTTWFVIAGLIATTAIYYEQYLIAGLCLIMKSILDAADGELSRVKKTPSYTGRYYDSIADFALNFLFLFTIGWKAGNEWYWILLAFAFVQLQGTLFNYYYVILRNRHSGDKTSRIFETEPPSAMPGESQRTVDLLFHTYNALYIGFDKAIYYMDPLASRHGGLPAWFMTGISIFGLGFQLISIAVMLNVGALNYVIPYFIFTGIFVPLMVLFRRLFL